MSKYLFFFFLDWLYWNKKGGISEIQVSCGLITLTTLLPLLDSSAINILISLFFSVGGDFAGGGGGGGNPRVPPLYHTHGTLVTALYQDYTDQDHSSSR